MSLLFNSPILFRTVLILGKLSALQSEYNSCTFISMIIRTTIFYSLMVILGWKPTQAQVLFEEVSFQSGIDHLQLNGFFFGGGIAVLDFDNDGWEDVYFTGGQNPDKLYRNLGNGQFSDVSIQSGISSLPEVTTMGVIAGDVNNDGYQDLIVTTFFGSESMLLANQGDGTFMYLPNAINDYDNWKTSASFGDINKDGLLDFYITAYVFNGSTILGPDDEIIGFDHDCSANQLFINNGDFSFSDVTSIYGVDDEGCGLATAFTDYDNDLDVDIHLANDFGQWVVPSALYQNQFPAANFIDVSDATNMAATFYGMGIAIGDYDRDADLDYYQTNLGRNLLSRNDEQFFTDATTQAGVENDSLNGLNITSWGCFFFDADNDAWPDLYVANGPIPAATFIANVLYDPNKLFLNNGDGTFEDVSAIAAVADTLRSRGAVYADFDKDGRMDVMVSNVHSNEDSAHVSYFHNITQNTNHWIEFNLEGVQSNRDAYGSHVTIWLDGRPTLAEVDGGSSHASKSSSIVHFGVGETSIVDSVNIVFPSGVTITRTNLTVDQRYDILEDVTVGVRTNSAELLLDAYYLGNEIHISLNQPTQLSVEMIDLSGRLLFSNSGKLPNGKSIVPIPQELSSGVYYIRLQSKSQSQVIKIYLD